MKRISKVIFLVLMVLVVGFGFIVKPKALGGPLEYEGVLPVGYNSLDFGAEDIYKPFGIFWDRVIYFNDNDFYYLDLWASNYIDGTIFITPHEDDTSQSIVKLIEFKDGFGESFYIFSVSSNEGFAASTLYVRLAIGYLDYQGNYNPATSFIFYEFVWFRDGPFTGQSPDEFYNPNSPTQSYEVPYNLKLAHNSINQKADNLLYVKELHNTNYWSGYESGVKFGKESAKSEYGLYINGVFYSGQDLYNYAFDKGLSDTTSSSGIGVLVSGFFSALAMFGNVEILPGLKIFYIIGFFLIIGLVIFLFKIRGK